MPVEFVDNLPKAIEKLYPDATKMVIVGIACKGLMNKLCPGHYAQAAYDVPENREQRLNQLRDSPLFQELSNRKLRIDVYMVHPYCDYALIRTKEENNASCRQDIWQGVNALRLLAHDLDDPGANITIQGSVEAFLLRANPYMSYTQIQHDGDGPSPVLFIGVLLRDSLGNDAPKLRVFDDEGEDEGRIALYEKHLVTLAGQRELLFKWHAKGKSEFVSEACEALTGHDAFLCHNKRDRDDVGFVAQTLQDQHGVLPWLDTDIGGGQNWVARIREVAREVRCAVLFFGSNGLGFYQAVEVGIFRKRFRQEGIKTIPVLLPGFEGSPTFSDFLQKVNHVDLRHKPDDNGVRPEGVCKQGIRRLARAIRKENGL